jgi:hypothetical protein
MDTILISGLIGGVAALLAAIIGAIAAFLVAERQHKHAVEQLNIAHAQQVQLLEQRMSDQQIFQDWRIAFDRAVFKGPWQWHTDQSKAKQGIEDIIKAINTGDIGGSTGGGKGGMSLINDQERYKKMEVVERRLNYIRSLVSKLEELAKAPQEGEMSFYDISNKIDHERDEIIETMNEIWKELGIRPLRKPSEFKTFQEAYGLEAF